MPTDLPVSQGLPCLLVLLLVHAQMNKGQEDHPGVACVTQAHGLSPVSAEANSLVSLYGQTLAIGGTHSTSFQVIINLPIVFTPYLTPGKTLPKFRGHDGYREPVLPPDISPQGRSPLKQ